MLFQRSMPLCVGLCALYYMEHAQGSPNMYGTHTHTQTVHLRRICAVAVPSLRLRLRAFIRGGGGSGGTGCDLYLLVECRSDGNGTVCVHRTAFCVHVYKPARTHAHTLRGVFPLDENAQKHMMILLFCVCVCLGGFISK